MKEFINLLNRNERRLVIAAGAVIAALLVFVLFIALPKRSAYFSRRQQINRQEKQLKALETRRLNKKEQLVDWIQARDKMKEVKETYFYPEKDGYKHVRKDLNRIFQKTGVRAEGIRYDYSELEKADIQKMIINFDIAGGYDMLKAFLYEIETLPKFIWVEKIHFGNIEEAPRDLSLSLTLAAYHAL